MWVRKAEAGCKQWSSQPEKDVFEGWHNGYLRLADPVLHRRCITLDKPARRVLIDDVLTMKGAHTVELFFHCAEQCRVDEVPLGYRIRHGARRVFLTLPQIEGGEREIFCGSVTPILGWVSRRFDSRKPTSTIVWRAVVTGPALLQTEISC